MSSLTPLIQYPTMIRTAESALKIMKSHVVGVGNVDTGTGLFTMAPIPNNTWICAYAPSAPFGPARAAAGDYSLEFKWRNVNVAVDGRKCELGLGQLINDGKLRLTSPLRK